MALTAKEALKAADHAENYPPMCGAKYFGRAEFLNEWFCDISNCFSNCFSQTLVLVETQDPHDIREHG